MTDPVDVTPTPGDVRRAAALMVHHGRQDQDGLRAVVAEIAESKRVLPAMLALITLTEEVVPLLYTVDGMDLLSRHVIRLAGLEFDGSNYR